MTGSPLAEATRRGFSIIPVGSDKRPALTTWKPYQTRRASEDELRQWAQKRPTGWAVVTGEISGLIVLDFDGERGLETMQALGLQPHVQTGSGGAHVYFAHPGHHVPTLNSKSKIEMGQRWPGLDIRADGGYACFAGRNRSGAYEWLRELDPEPIDLLPTDLQEFLGLLPPRPPQAPPARPAKNVSTCRTGRVSADRLIDRALSRIRSEGRNNAGFWLAVQLRDNQFAETEAESIVCSFAARTPATNTKGQHEPYTDQEALASLREAYARSPREPWTPRSSQSGTGAAPRQNGSTDGPVTEEPEEDWRTGLIRNEKGQPRALLANAMTALRGAVEWRHSLAFDEFLYQTVLRQPAPWGGQAGDLWTDIDDIRFAEWLQREGIHVSRDVASQAVESAAQQYRVHPVRDYLDSLVWDRVERLPSWLAVYAGVQQSSYVEAVGTRFLIGAVARTYEPGCKMDTALILEGGQGLGKSTLVKRLFGAQWFSDEIADLGSKDASMQTRGVWCIELAELDNLTRAESGRIKAFMSRTVDRFRPPYGKRLIDSPRHCIFVGTCNHSAYLKDETGGRRFWPVACTAIDLEGIERDRDQLLAEAVVRFKRGEPWWLDTEELHESASEEQEQRLLTDPWEDKIALYLAAREDVSVPEILEQCFPNLSQESWTRQHQMRVAACLQTRGWVRYRAPKDRLGQRLWRYKAPEV